MNRVLAVLAATAALVTSLAIPARADGVGATVNLPRDPVLEQRMLDHADTAPVRPDKGAGTARPDGLSRYGSYPVRPGVILVTPDLYKNLIPTGHAAIVWRHSTLVEAIDVGVQRRPNNWYATKTQAYGVALSRTTTAQDAAAAEWADAQVGKPYLYPWYDNGTGYFNTWHRDMFYCSHLVWAAFKDLYGINLDTSSFGSAVYPMELVWTDQTYLVYRKR